MKHLCLFLLSVFILLGPSIVNTRQTDNQSKPKMTNTEKVLSWKGERVYFLKPFRPDSTIYTWCESEQKLPEAKYAGRTGVITELKIVPERIVVPGQLNNGAYQLEISFEDNKETISLCTAEPLIFLANIEAGKRLVGKPLWIKNQEDILDCSTVFNVSAAGVRGATKISKVGYASKLMFTDIELGNTREAYIYHVKTESGQEGCLDVEFWNGNFRMGFDDRFYLEGSTDFTGRSFLRYFYSEDPHKLHPDWKPSIWQLIDQGKVAIGMIEEMAKYACGGEMKEIGIALGESGDPSTIYECHGKKILVEKGKVTKYVE